LLGASGQPAALRTLAALLGHADELDCTLLSQIGRLALACPLPIDDGVCGMVRQRLESSSIAVRREAALACGRLHDEQALDALVHLLDDAAPSPCHAAHWSLRSISGLELRRDGRVWRTWLERELAWWDGSAGSALRDLRDSDPKQVAAALHEIGHHRLRRPELVSAVIDVLRDERVSLAVMACSVLGELGDPAARSVLETCAVSDKPELRLAAQAALERLGTKDFPGALAFER